LCIIIIIQTLSLQTELETYTLQSPQQTMSATLTGISGRVFAITGGASGIGAATIHELARQNASAIWIGDWNDKAFSTVTKEINDINPSIQVYTKKLDVSDSKAIDAWVDKIVEVSGGIHGAVNLAGIGQSAPVAEEYYAGKTPAILLEDDKSMDSVT
jgi:chanoclavine-I dehydrogenase